MQLNHALFEAGDRCGYVLKPEVLIDKDHRFYGLFNPFRNKELMIHLDIQVKDKRCRPMPIPHFPWHRTKTGFSVCAPGLMNALPEDLCNISPTANLNLSLRPTYLSSTIVPKFSCQLN